MNELIQTIGANAIWSLIGVLILGIILIIVPLGRADAYKWVFGIILVLVAILIFVFGVT